MTRDRSFSIIKVYDRSHFEGPCISTHYFAQDTHFTDTGKIRKVRIALNNMKQFSGTIRKPDRNPSIPRMGLTSIAVVILGFLLGVFQKWLDGSTFNELPLVFQQLDVTNYFGRFAIWVLLAAILSVYASTPIRAAVNTFLFFISMVSGYYLYCRAVLGFLPISYAVIWIVLSFASPFFAYVCWYAKGRGMPAILISAIILGVLLAQAVFLTQGFRITHIPEVITWAAGLILLRRKPREFALMFGLSLVIALVYQSVVPYWG